MHSHVDELLWHGIARTIVNTMKSLFFLLLLISSSVLADFSGQVIKVIDGDTVDILTTENEKIRVRLFGIDAPERGQAYANKSKLFLASLISGKDVLVKENEKDIYHRSLGTIFYRDKNINAKMVENGYAWAYRYRNKATDESMVKLEEKAKQQHLGLWQDSNPIAPWDFKRKH